MAAHNVTTTPKTAKALSSTREYTSSRVGVTSDRQAIVVVDPMSTGATLAAEAVKRGLAVICCWSDVCPAELRGHSKAEVDYLGIVMHKSGQIEATCDSILSICAVSDVICGSEPGVMLADELSEALYAPRT